LRFDEIVEGQVIVMNSKEIHGPLIRKASRNSHKEVFWGSKLNGTTCILKRGIGKVFTPCATLSGSFIKHTFLKTDS
jgi:hypothetical protein